MARRKRSRKHTSGMLKIQFQLATANNSSTPSTTEFIDISQCLSMASRRFYRQGMCYNVVGFKIISDSNTGTGRVDISTVPPTWVASGAWQKSFSLWKEMNDQALDIDPSIKPKFYDFKHYIDSDHVAKQSSPGESDGNLVPIEAGFVQTGEWDYSVIQIPNDAVPGNTTEHTLHMVGAEAVGTSMPMIQGYADSRAYPQSPDPVTGNAKSGWMNELFDVGDNLEDITNSLQHDNDELPYSQVDYPGGDTLAPYVYFAQEAVITPTTIGAETHVGGCLAYSGLLRIDNGLTGDSEDSGFNLMLYLAPGNYKGIDAIPMQDVN